MAAELFRRTNKVLTITGYKLDAIPELTNIDRVIDWGLKWGEAHKAAEAEVSPGGLGRPNGSNGNGSKYSIDEIELIVRTGVPAGGNRSEVFHGIVGHYVGCGWSVEQITEHLQQHQDGIGARCLSEHRLYKEVARSAGKYAPRALPLFNGNGGRAKRWETEAPQPKTPEKPAAEPEPEPEPAEPDIDDPRLNGIEDDDNDDPDEIVDDDSRDAPASDSKLPPLHAHGEADRRPMKDWLIKRLIPAVGHGLLSGQWGAGKTFIVFDLAAALVTGQPFIGHAIKRRCGVLLIAAEGADEVRLRLDAVAREKCGGMPRAPFRWYETAPLLLHNGSAEMLIAMARQADKSLQEEFGLPLGLVIIDTIAACAGYGKAGEENDAATGQALMNILKVAAHELNCFVLGVDHFGKNLEAGTRGASSKEAAADLVLACLADKQLNGTVVDTRLAVRKNRAGRQGHEFPFVLRTVEASEPDEDGEPVTTMVVDWQPIGADIPYTQPDPWTAARRQDQRTAVLRLKRVLLELMAEHGVELPIPPDGPTARMIDQESVRERFYARTSADGTPTQKTEFRRKRLNRAVDWAEDQRLIAIEEVGGVAYLRLVRHEIEEPEAA